MAVRDLFLSSCGDNETMDHDFHGSTSRRFNGPSANREPASRSRYDSRYHTKENYPSKLSKTSNSKFQRLSFGPNSRGQSGDSLITPLCLSSKPGPDRLDNGLPAEFKDVLVDALPDLGSVNCLTHAIKTKRRFKPSAGVPKTLEAEDRAVLCNELQRLEAAGRIRPSDSLCGAPLLSVSADDDDVELYVDYRELNGQTAKPKSPAPQSGVFFQHLQGSTIFTRLSLHSGLYQVRIDPEDVHKTAFETTFGRYEWLTLHPGLRYAPITLQKLMNEVFRDGLNKFVYVHLGHILVFSKTREEHDKHLRWVLEQLRSRKLFLKAVDCEFYQRRIFYLGTMVSREGYAIDEAKVTKICDWPRPRISDELRAFLSYVRHFKCFIENFDRISAPLYEHKLFAYERQIEWTQECQSAFDALKNRVAAAPPLVFPDNRLPFIVTADATARTVALKLEQVFSDGSRHVVAFESGKLGKSQLKWSSREKHLFAIMRALNVWRPLLLGPHFKIYTKHVSLNRLQRPPGRLESPFARWFVRLAEYDCEIIYDPNIL